MRKYHLPVSVLILTFGLIFSETNLFAQQKKEQPATVVAIRNFSGFSEILSMDTLIHDLNVLNNDKSILYIKFTEGIHTDFIVDVKSAYSIPKKIVTQTVSGLGNYSSVTLSGPFIYNDGSHVPSSLPKYSGGLWPLRPIMDYYNNGEISLYNVKDSEIGFGTVKITISQYGLESKPGYKKAVYLEDAAFLIEESLFDEVVSNMFSYFHNRAIPEKSLY